MRNPSSPQPKHQADLLRASSAALRSAHAKPSQHQDRVACVDQIIHLDAYVAENLLHTAEDRREPFGTGVGASEERVRVDHSRHVGIDSSLSGSPVSL